MDIIGPLMLGTLGFVVVMAYINMRQTEDKLAETRNRKAQANAKAVAAK